jgi:hypothetical protein
MGEQNEIMDPEGDEVEAHMLKEGVAAAAAAGAIFAASAQARPVDPNTGTAGEVTQSARPVSTTGHTQKKTDHHQRQRNRADVEKDG